MREKSVYNAVWASVAPSARPRNWTSSLLGLVVGPASRRGQQKPVHTSTDGGSWTVLTCFKP